MLSAASRRSGDRQAQAVQQYNLGVTHDNNERFSKAVHVRVTILLI